MNIYSEYAELERRISALEQEKEVLRSKIAEGLPEDGYKSEDVTAYWVLKKSYKYSPKVEGLTAELKSTKKLEEENGVATVEKEVKQLTIKIK